MSVSRTLVKAKAVVQDLELGLGRTTQTRGGSSVQVDKLGMFYLVESVEQLKTFPVTAKYAAIAVDNVVSNFWYNSASTAEENETSVIKPTGAPGRWLLIPAAGGGGGAEVESEVIQDYYFRANDPADDIHIEVTTARTGDFCYVSTLVKGANRQFDSNVFPKDASTNAVSITGLTVADEPIVLPSAFRPINETKVPLHHRWNSSTGQRGIAAYLCVLTDGTLVLRNTEPSTFYLAGEDDNTDPNFIEFARSTGWWRRA